MAGVPGAGNPGTDHSGPTDWRGLQHHIRSRLLTGLFVIFPVGFTVWILYILFRFLDNILRPAIDPWLGFPIPGLGLLAVIVLLYLVGLLAANVLGRQILVAAESLLLRMPFVRAIYLASKQVIDTLRLPGKGAFQRVVLVQYPRRGIWALAFVTGTAHREEDGATLLHLFLPTSPNPTSGMMLILRETEVVGLNITVEEGIRLVVSGGILSPHSYPVPREAGIDRKEHPVEIDASQAKALTEGNKGRE
jgi:uncharacterized membrane protein